MVTHPAGGMWPGRAGRSVRRRRRGVGRSAGGRTTPGGTWTVADKGDQGAGMTFTVAFALAAALSSAVNLMTQHSASAGAPKREKGWRLVAYLFRQSPWLFVSVAAAGA